jgi:hypothetical protein
MLGSNLTIYEFLLAATLACAPLTPIVSMLVGDFRKSRARKSRAMHMPSR